MVRLNLANKPQAEAASPIGLILVAVSRYGIMGVGLLYACGLLIVNIHLASYGLVSLDLARPDYVMAGALWALISVPMPVIAVMVGVQAWDRFIVAVTLRVQAWDCFIRRQVIIGAAYGVIVGLLGLFAPLMIVETVLVEPSGATDLWAAFGFRRVVFMSVNLAILLVAAYSARALVKDGWYTESDREQWQPVSVLFGSFVGAMLLLASLMAYSLFLYPELSKKFGGGRKSHVLVVLSEPQSVLLGVPLSEDGRVIGPVGLLLEAGESVAVIGYDETKVEQRGARYNVGAVSIQRKNISNMIYLPSGPWPERRGSAEPCARAPDVHLERWLAWGEPWLQLMPDSPEDCERLETLAAQGFRTCGPATSLVAWRLRAILGEWNVPQPTEPVSG